MLEETNLLQDGFGANPCFRALIADWDGQTVGYALFVWLLLDLGGAEIVSRGSVCARAVSQPRDWKGVTGFCRTHCDAGKSLRSAVGGARLE